MIIFIALNSYILTRFIWSIILKYPAIDIFHFFLFISLHSCIMLIWCFPLFLLLHRFYLWYDGSWPFSALFSRYLYPCSFPEDICVYLFQLLQKIYIFKNIFSHPLQPPQVTSSLILHLVSVPLLWLKHLPKWSLHLYWIQSKKLARISLYHEKFRYV